MRPLRFKPKRPAPEKANPEYRAILRLADALRDRKIPHELLRLYDGWQICFPSEEDRALSVIEHFCSYGNSEDLLELWDGGDTAEGNLSAGEALARIETAWEAGRNADG